MIWIATTTVDFSPVSSRPTIESTTSAQPARASSQRVSVLRMESRASPPRDLDVSTPVVAHHQDNSIREMSPGSKAGHLTPDNDDAHNLTDVFSFISETAPRQPRSGDTL
jgi:hypothetical protein